MMLGRCPVCHSHLALEAIVQDEAARELLGVLSALEATLSRALVGYLGLWRPAKQDLRWDRALKIAREVLALEADAARLSWSLSETTEAIRAKGGATPIKSHGYLKRVLEGAPPSGAAVVVAAPAGRPVRAPTRLTGTEEAVLAIRNVRFGADAQAHTQRRAPGSDGDRRLGVELDGIDDDAIDAHGVTDA